MSSSGYQRGWDGASPGSFYWKQYWLDRWCQWMWLTPAIQTFLPRKFFTLKATLMEKQNCLFTFYRHRLAGQIYSIYLKADFLETQRLWSKPSLNSDILWSQLMLPIWKKKHPIHFYTSINMFGMACPQLFSLNSPLFVNFKTVKECCSCLNQKSNRQTRIQGRKIEIILGGSLFYIAWQTQTEINLLKKG